MKLYIDLDTLTLVAGPTDRRAVARLETKRGDHTPMEIRFLRAGVPVRLDPDTGLAFGCKPNGKFDTEPVVFADDFAQSEIPESPDPDADPHWTGAPSFHTEPLDELFLIDEDPDNDPPHIDLMAEFTWSAPGAPGPTTTRTISVRVLNDVIRDAEGSPTNLPTPDAWLSARAVRYDIAQDLTDPQKTQARENIGLPSLNVVFITASDYAALTTEQQNDPGIWYVIDDEA
jgi:hypothetical protein